MSAVIPVNKKYRIELDNNSWQVSFWHPRKKHSNEGAWEGLSWHRTLQKAGESLVQRLVVNEDLEGIDEVINALSVSSQLGFTPFPRTVELRVIPSA